ncbi:MAG TPA: CDP-alcohol phosphatidyltransferase family protein [Acidimicrobiales bacterium]|nr:CDP-alcohol phosphatidyltransferase family protein [Acidimicrobiales bacterium]
MPDAAGDDKVLTIPNVISIVRLLCIPLFVWLLFARDDRASAAWLLAALGATDWVDGYIARHFNQISTLGKVLDPTADRVLLLTAALSLIIDHDVPVWLAVAVLVREALVSIAVLALAAAGARRIDVQWAGKAGTLALMIALPLFLASHSTLGWHRGAGITAWLFALPGLVLGWYAAVTYVPLARRALREGRVGSAT